MTGWSCGIDIYLKSWGLPLWVSVEDYDLGLILIHIGPICVTFLKDE